jgi:hypothetical protein
VPDFNQIAEMVSLAVDGTGVLIIVLGLIVLIRTFLSMSLEVELEGRLPWRGSAAPERPEPGKPIAPTRP